MENSPLISVIVPVYNVAEYLPECLDSIINQTYTNLEIILVDDGSTDECPKICDEYAEKDGRIRVIHKKNGGLSDARNAGLDICTGEWIGFVDSDDFVDKSMYQKLYETAISESADVVVCQSIRYENGKFIHWGKKKKLEIIKSKVKMINHMFCGGGQTIAVWLKLYKANIFNNIRFPKGLTNEDAFIILDVLEKTGCMIIIPDELYYYRLRSGSITNTTVWNERIFDTVLAYKHNMEIVKNVFPENIEECICRLHWAYRFSIKSALKVNDALAHMQEIENYQNEFRQLYFSSLENHFLSLRGKLDGMVIAALPIRLLRLYVTTLQNIKQMGAKI